MPLVIEADAIPYEPALLRGERLLVLAPHPDDEVIGCGGLVALHLAERRPVRIVIATDGAEAGQRQEREEESRRGVSRLGKADLVFLGFPDRGLGPGAGPALREQLLGFRPDLILVPGPLEVHPDHLALCRALCQLAQNDATLFAELAMARVGFYEVSHPLSPNAIVDITSVADLKYSAIGEHRSQLAVRDYLSYTRGLNTYRTMTLPPEVKFAEAYFVTRLASLRTTPFSELQRRSGGVAEARVERETLPVSVVIRTKDRPALLREAVASVKETGYPCQIVVVNDGGARPDIEGVTLVHHETSHGRSEAANAGVREASNAFIAFLDDDDLFYPDHLAKLAGAAGSHHAGWYSDAVSAFLRPGPSGNYETQSRQRLFAQDYDPELLLVDNYIPLPALFVARESFLAAGGFDPAFDLFEDWDFLIRLSRRGPLLRIPGISCEIRHFEGGSSVVLASPEGSDRFRQAKLQIWKKHAHLVSNDIFANIFERQKRQQSSLFSQVVETAGQLDHHRVDISRLEREKGDLLQQMVTINDSINGYAQRVRELEGSLHALDPLVEDYRKLVVTCEQHERENDSLRQVNALSHAELERLRAEIRRLEVEIGRLQGLLDLIYKSRTWKVHNVLERLRGRG